MPAPKGNNFAGKEDGERVAFPVNVRGTAAERKAWRKAAAGQKWNEWARAALNNSAGYARNEPVNETSAPAAGTSESTSTHLKS